MHKNVKGTCHSTLDPTKNPFPETSRAPHNNTITEVVEAHVCGQLITQLSGPEKRITLI